MWNWIHNHHDDLIALGPLATIAATLVAVVVSGIVGLAQWRIARTQKDIALDKLRLELFDKRYAVYEATKAQAFALRPSSVKRIEYELFGWWQSVMNEAPFLFPPDVVVFTRRVASLAFDWQQLGIVMSDESVNAADRTLAEQDRSHIPKEMGRLYLKCDGIFMPELSYTQLTGVKRLQSLS